MAPTLFLRACRLTKDICYPIPNTVTARHTDGSNTLSVDSSDSTYSVRAAVRVTPPRHTRVCTSLPRLPTPTTYHYKSALRKGIPRALSRRLGPMKPRHTPKHTEECEGKASEVPSNQTNKRHATRRRG